MLQYPDSQIHRRQHRRPAQQCGKDFRSIAEAMPEAKYSFIPTAGKFDDARRLRRADQARRLLPVRVLQ
jgi:hypothetical protein